MTKLQIYLVDDHTILREGLRSLIDVQPDMCVVGEASDGSAAVNAVNALHPDVVVMDISMPVLDGADATAQIRRNCPDVRVLALTAHEDGDYARLLLTAGASGYLLKRAAAADLVRAIRAVKAGHLYLDTTMDAPAPASLRPAPVSRAIPPHDLSEREVEVLKMVALGYSMRRMAATLELSPRTLETYKMRAMTKLNLENRAGIVRFALQQGWLEDA